MNASTTTAAAASGPPLSEALCEAAGNAQPGKIRELLAGGADAAAAGPDLKAPLHCLAEASEAAGRDPEGWRECLRLLLGAGAVLEAPHSGSGETALHFALCVPDETRAFRVKALLEAGADPSAPTPWGMRPVHLIAAEQVSSGANNAEARPGAAWWVAPTPEKWEDAGAGAVLAALLRFGADINARATNARTPLHHAAEGAPLDIVERLLAAGADPAALDARGNTPLAHGWECRDKLLNWKRIMEALAAAQNAAGRAFEWGRSLQALESAERKAKRAEKASEAPPAEAGGPSP